MFTEWQPEDCDCTEVVVDTVDLLPGSGPDRLEAVSVPEDLTEPGDRLRHLEGKLFRIEGLTRAESDELRRLQTERDTERGRAS